MPVPPREVLKGAREAARAGDHEVALANYEHFFDNALKDQDEDTEFYGVRLSYCLAEWAKLGESYPPAKKRLEEKPGEALAELEKTRHPAFFHDFISINEQLGRERQSIEQFLKYHEKDRPLAEEILHYIWDDLVDLGQWEVCAAYLPRPSENYARAVDKFDEAMKLAQDHPELGGERFKAQVAGWFVTDVSNICLVLKNAGRNVHVSRILGQLELDMTVRKRHDLVGQISARVAL